MFAGKVAALLTLALGAIAAPLVASTTTTAPADANDGKPFKLALTINNQQFYLNAKGEAVPDRAAGITCSINAGAIACGDKKQGYTYDNRHTPEYSPLVPTADAGENKNWSIGPGGEIKWGAKSGGEVHFSTKPFFGNTIFAEICSTYGHPDRVLFTPRPAKAVFVQ